MENNLKAVILGRIEAIANAEKITKSELGHVSRELLLYVPESNDIDVVNKLLLVLTPMNKSTAILFFKHFLPWTAEETGEGDFSRFSGKMKKEKQVDRKLAAIKEFLSVEENNIWTWAGQNVNVEYKPKDFASQVTKAVQTALKGEKKENGETPPLPVQDIIAAVLRAGIPVEAMLTLAQERIEEMEAAQAMAKAA